MVLLVCATPLALVVADAAGGALVSHEVERTVESDEGEGDRMLAAAVEPSAPDPHDVLDARPGDVLYASPDRDRRLRPPNG